jgi:hypothetical protein
VRDGCKLDVGFGECYLNVRPFGSHDETFNCYVIDLAIMLSLLPLIFEIHVGASGDGVYGSKGWEIDNLLDRLLVLLRRWRWNARLYFWLRCLGACCRIRYLQRSRGIGEI